MRLARRAVDGPRPYSTASDTGVQLIPFADQILLHGLNPITLIVFEVLIKITDVSMPSSLIVMFARASPLPNWSNSETTRPATRTRANRCFFSAIFRPGHKLQ